MHSPKMSLTTLFLPLLLAAVWLSNTTVLGQDLSDLLRAAGLEYKPITAEQLKSAREQLATSAGHVNRWLETADEEELKWWAQLQWDQMQAQIATSEANLPLLRSVLRGINSDRKGFEHARIRNFSEHLQSYIDMAAASTRGDLEDYYKRQLEALAAELEKFEARPTPRLEYAIGRRLDNLEALKLAEKVVAEVRRRHHNPNVYADASAGFLSAAASRPISEPGKVRDCILGTTIRGTSYTTGSVDLHLVPSKNRAVLEFISNGQVTSQNRGYNSPVVIRSTGYTDYHATKRVELSDPSFSVMPSTATATTRTKIHSVRSQRGGLFSGIISNVGRDRVYQSKRQAERIASRHAERRIRNEFDDELLKEVKDLRRQYRDEFRLPLIRQNAFPSFLQFSSTSDKASVVMTQAARGQLGASGDPPAAPEGHDLVMRVHQSAASNYSEVAVGGSTLSEDSQYEDAELDRPLPTWIQELLDEMESEDEEDDGEELVLPEDSPSHEDEFKPWSMTFRRVRPASVEFNDGQIKLIVHLEKLATGTQEFDRWDLLVDYDLHLQNGGLFLIRSGDINAWETGYDPESGKRPRDFERRNILIKEINELSDRGDGFPETVEIPMIAPTGALADVGPLVLRAAISESGWLTLAWDRQ